MYIKVEPTGCCERKGMVQVRLCFFLDEGDFGYDKHHVQVPDFTGQRYEGEIKDGMPVDEVNYQKWIDSLPKVWQNNPFHNHFIQVEPNVTDKEIMDKAEALIKEAYVKWEKDEPPHLYNAPVTMPTLTTARLSACEAKVSSLKSTVLERAIEKVK